MAGASNTLTSRGHPDQRRWRGLVVSWAESPGCMLSRDGRQRRRHGAEVARDAALAGGAVGAVALHSAGQAPAERVRRKLNGRFRGECLNQHLFGSLPRARRIIKASGIDYNAERPYEPRSARPRAFAVRPGCTKNEPCLLTRVLSQAWARGLAYVSPFRIRLAASSRSSRCTPVRNRFSGMRPRSHRPATRPSSVGMRAKDERNQADGPIAPSL